MPLTSELVEASAPRGRPYKLFDGGGLFLLVTANGARYWRLKYQFAGKAKSLSLGVYPDVTLAQARAFRGELRALLLEGIDPSAARKAVREQALERQTDEAPRFLLDSGGALSFRFGCRSVVLSARETLDLRSFLDATRGVRPR